MKTELVTNLKRQATRILSDIRESGESVLITEHGKPSAYLVDVDSFEFMQNKLRVLEGIVSGERALLEERTYSEEEAKKKMSKWLD
ncbi:MAG: type II toxin-antitoxin system Phd/YefM family antitoxin [Spirochaetaceae bacterium]